MKILKTENIVFSIIIFSLLFLLIRCGDIETDLYLGGDISLEDARNYSPDTQVYYDYGYQYDYGNIGRDTGYIEPERPNPYAAVPPITSDKYLFLLNPSNNSIAIIEPESLKVFSVKMDFSPKNLIVIPKTDYALVLADKASKIAMLSIDKDTTNILSFPLGQQYNDISVSPDGKYIIAYYNELLRQNNEIYAGEGRINLIKTEDISKLKINPNEKIYKEIDVGRRITNIFYSQERNTAYIVSKERIYFLRLDDPFNELGNQEFININPNYTENVKNRIATYLKNSEYIVLRYLSGQSLLVISTVDLKSYEIRFESVITDMRVAKGMNKIILSFRDVGKIKIIPIPQGIVDNSLIKEVNLGDFLAGSLEICENQEFKKVLIYTNVYYREELMILDLNDYSFEKIDHSYELDKAINFILCSPNGLSAIIIHKKGTDPNEHDPTEIAINNQEGFSVFGLVKKKINTQLLLNTQPKTISFLDNSTYAMVTSSNPSTNEFNAYIVELTKPIINDDNIQFYSDIIYAGSIPGKDIFYVLQKHPVGRISFIFMPSGIMKTITGFELNSLIE
ncbi:MAG: hypothetical protein N2746_02860 [Deltaproteobacteria bacterium]|nr:hypothetical protein [Deltaproteobacteria bacterium]